jgi:hypothetical protein
MWVLPAGSFEGAVWARVEPAALWAEVARALGCGRVAVKAEVDADVMRESHLRVLHPPGADGWVQVRMRPRPGPGPGPESGPESVFLDLTRNFRSKN